MDSDNGAEFINNQLIRYCAQEQLTFTRSRVGRKNDNAFVEQKNWSVVRRLAGYDRFDTQKTDRCPQPAVWPVSGVCQLLPARHQAGEQTALRK